MILPDATLGILGGGQIGRMFVVTARTMGYKVIVLDPEQDCPAAQMADGHICASYTNSLALDSLARECAAITCEFENIPAESLEHLAGLRPVSPSGTTVAVAQDRIRQKRLIEANGFETARFVVVTQKNALWQALKQVGTPALIKPGRSGYAGKRQRLVRNLGEAEFAFDDLGGIPCVLEERLAIQTEVSVVIARGGESAVAYPPSENRYRDGVLDVSVAPARISPLTAGTATAKALQLAALLGYKGVVTVKFFILQDGRLLLNKIAPGPHNTGHYTLDACITSQFEQQVRVMCGLPLGDTTQFRPAVTVNLAGDLWHEGREPAWEHVLCNPRAKLYLYGEREAFPASKTGHYTCIGDDVEETLSSALVIRSMILGKAVRSAD